MQHTRKRITANIEAGLAAQIEAAKRPGESLSEAVSRLVERGLNATATQTAASAIERTEARLVALVERTEARLVALVERIETGTAAAGSEAVRADLQALADAIQAVGAGVATGAENVAELRDKLRALVDHINHLLAERKP